RDLVRAGPASLVVAGPRQPPEVHAIAHAMNAVLASAATRFTAPAVDETAHGPASLAELARAIDRGEVDTLVSAALDPAWTAPADLDLGARLARVPTLVHTALREDATAAHATWFLPA